MNQALVAYAFTAGAVATINPCGFAMLPAYLAYYLGTSRAEFEGASTLVRAGRAIRLGGILTAGFVLLFGLAGFLITAGVRAIVTYMPWIGLLVGLGLVLLGGWLLLGRWRGVPALSRIEVPQRGGSWGVFLYGIAFALASLSCTLPIFLVAVGSVVTTEGLAPGFVQFVSYGVGMGAVMTALTLSVALFKGALVSYLRRWVPYVERISALLLFGAGIYIIYYWLTTGGLLSLLT